MVKIFAYFYFLEYNYIVKQKINLLSNSLKPMESANSIQSNEKLSNLMDKINETCDALISALEVNAQSVGEYGG
jgi:hypothetical protein